MNAYFGIASLLNGLFALFAALYVLFRNPKSSLYLSFFVFAGSVSLWAIFYSFWQFQSKEVPALFFIRLAMAFCAFIPFSFLWFAEVLTETRARFLPALVYWSIPVFFCVMNFSPWMIPRVEPRLYFPYWPVPGFLMNVFVVLFFSMILYSFVLLFRAWFPSTGMRRWQLRWVTLTVLFAFAGGCTNWFLWYHIPIPPFPNIFVAVCFLLLAYAVMRHQLFDIDMLADAVQEAKLSAIGVLAAGINHEIRNPLFVVKGHAESLLQQLKDGRFNSLSPDMREQKLTEVMERTISQINRAMEITKKLVSFSKPRSGPAEPETVALKEVFDDILFLVRHEIELEKIKLEIGIDPGIKVWADRKQLEEIFFNLIVNSYQAMPDGGALQILAGTTHGSVSVSVSDTGQGIPREQLKRIFEPFFTTKMEKGTGLGLYIVKKLVERNGGKIKVESRPGQGTTFRVVLPHK